MKTKIKLANTYLRVGIDDFRESDFNEPIVLRDSRLNQILGLYISNGDGTGLVLRPGDKGDKGDKGDSGNSFIIKGVFNTLKELEGISGKEGDAFAVGVGQKKNIYIWDINTLQWENIGYIEGEQGEPGLPCNLTIGTVTCDSKKCNVTIEGESPNQILNFDLQKGDKGEPNRMYRGLFSVIRDLEDIPIHDLEIGTNADIIETESKWTWNISYIGDEDNYTFVDYLTLQEYYPHPSRRDFFYNSTTNTIWEFGVIYPTWVNTNLSFPPKNTVIFDEQGLPISNGTEVPGYEPDVRRWIDTMFEMSKQGPKGDEGIKGEQGFTPEIGVNENWYINNIDTTKPSRGLKGDSGDVGTTHQITFSYAGITTEISRVGNIVMWSVTGNATAVSGTPQIPSGYRPMLSASSYTGQSQGSTPKNISVIGKTGLITITSALAGQVSFSMVWVTNESI